MVSASKKENINKISSIEKISRLKHKSKLELLVNKIKNKKLSYVYNLCISLGIYVGDTISLEIHLLLFGLILQ